MKNIFLMVLFISTLLSYSSVRADADPRLSLKECYVLTYPDSEMGNRRIKILVDFPRKMMTIEELDIKDPDLPTGTVHHQLKKPYILSIQKESLDRKRTGWLEANGDDAAEGSGVSLKIGIFPRDDGTLGAEAKIDIGHEEIGFNYYPQQMTATVVQRQK